MREEKSMTTTDKFIAQQPACAECGATRPERYGHFPECSQFLIDAAPRPAPDAAVCKWMDGDNELQSGPHEFSDGRCSTCGMPAPDAEVANAPNEIARALVREYIDWKDPRYRPLCMAIEKALSVSHSVCPERDTYQCDACGKIVPESEVKNSIPSAGVEGTFCHECRHGKDCDCLPAPDTEGEWSYNGPDTQGYHIREAGNGDCIAHVPLERHAARIVSDHSAVPLLVETLTAIKQRAEFALSTPGLIRGRDELQNAVHAADAALASIHGETK